MCKDRPRGRPTGPVRSHPVPFIVWFDRAQSRFAARSRDDARIDADWRTGGDHVTAGFCWFIGFRISCAAGRYSRCTRRIGPDRRAGGGRVVRAGGHLFDVTDEISAAQTLVNNDSSERCRRASGLPLYRTFCSATSFLPSFRHSYCFHPFAALPSSADNKLWRRAVCRSFVGRVLSYELLITRI